MWARTRPVESSDRTNIHSTILSVTRDSRTGRDKRAIRNQRIVHSWQKWPSSSPKVLRSKSVSGTVESVAEDASWDVFKFNCGLSFVQQTVRSADICRTRVTPSMVSSRVERFRGTWLGFGSRRKLAKIPRNLSPFVSRCPGLGRKMRSHF